MNKSEEYLKISEEIVNGVGGMDNIQGSAHCATRLRIVLKDNDKADMEKLENINKVKGALWQETSCAYFRRRNGKRCL